MIFKRNITITTALVITECLISIIPSIIFVFLFFMSDRIVELFSTLLVIPYFALIINIILFVVSLIAQPFLKTEFNVKKDALVVKKENDANEICYYKIANITYDFGDLSKFNPKPSQLVLFDKDCNQLLSVNNPSIIMTAVLKSKCKNAKVCYYHNKRFLYLLLLINGIVLFISMLIKLFA